jgi:WD40 repeat protein
MGHFIAAADVRPQMAPVWLREAFTTWNSPHQSWDRAKAMAALLHLAGESETAFVIDWFYKTEAISSGTSDHSVFIKEFQRRRPRHWRSTAAAIAKHPGFETMETMALIYLGLMINDLHGQPLFDQELFTDDRESELRNAIRRSLDLPEMPIRWIDPASPDPIARLNGHSDTPNEVIFSNDGTTMVTTGEDTKIVLWNAKTGELINTSTSRHRHPRVQAAGGEPSHFFFGNRSGGIPLVDLAAGRVVRVLTHNGTWTQTIARAEKTVTAVVNTTGGGASLVCW